MFLCPKAKEGLYLLSMSEDDGTTTEYVISDDSQAWGTTENGEGPQRLSQQIG